MKRQNGGKKLGAPSRAVVLGDLTDAMQDYLRALLELQPDEGRVSTSAIATRLGVAPPSASEMVTKLAALGLADHERYRGVRLTPAGERIALEVLRHHRLLERYLVDRLGLSIDEVHAEADRLEHALSEELEAKIDAELGYPTHDPHGDPIPDSELRVAPGRDQTLLDLAPGERAVVSRVPDGDPELLRYLTELGLVPGSSVELVSFAPFGGPIAVRTKSGDHAISRELAERIAAN
jgi:DtxR family Mn-dependent transcriptional regulator